MPQYPASSFESAVGGFMQGYGTVRGMRRENAEDARRAEAERREAEDREMRRAVALAGMGREGIVPHDQVSAAHTPSAPGIPSMRVQVGRRLGNTPYSQDLTRTPEAQARAREIEKEQRRLEQMRPAIAMARRGVPGLQSASDAEVGAWLQNKDLREGLKPAAPRRIDPLSPEGIAATAARERAIGPIRRQFAPPRQEGDSPAATLPSRQNDFADQYIDAANGDPRLAQSLAERNQAQAAALGMTREHYYGAATRFKKRNERSAAGGAIEAAIAKVIAETQGK